MTADAKAKRVQQAIEQVIDRQLSDNDPPEMRHTMTRLMDAGFSKPEARRLIGHVVAREVLAVIADGQRFDAARYVRSLRQLPDLP